MKSLFSKILTLSNSYNYYKSNYELIKNQVGEYQIDKNEIQNKLNGISNCFESLQKEQNGLQNLYNNIKNELNAIMVQQNHLSIKQDYQNGKIINIIFIINFRVNVSDSIIQLLEKDPQFNPTVVIIPYGIHGLNTFDKGLTERQLQEYEDNYAHFKRKGFNVIKGYDAKNRTLIDIELELKPDVIFYSTQWEETFPEQFRMENLPKNILFCYIPYGIHSAKVEDIQFNRELHKKAWKIFYPTQIHKELAAKYSDVGSSNVVVTGYPKMDSLLNGSHEKSPYLWKDSSHQKKRVIWAPHHSVNTYICFSTFDKNYKFFYDLAEKYSEIEWIFKPHPNLRYYHIIASTCPNEESFTEEKLVNYYNAWNNLPNATLYEGGDYLNMFATSDAMITDSDSFMSEYLYSGNPGLFLTNPLQKFNEYGEIIKNAWYQIDGTDFNEIENFLNDVVINEEDPLKTTRENIYNKYLKTDKPASENIYNYIKRSLTL